MIVAYTKADVIEYMGVITEHVDMDHPVLLDKYIMGTECEVDAICDGENFLIPGIMELVERTGVHSGDSISVYPAQHLTKAEIDTIVDYTGRFARELHVTGLVNVQYAVSNGKVYVIEVNPRSSRTVPYISKVTGVPMVDLAVRCCLGEKLTDMGYGTGLHPNAPYVAVKVPVFSFEKLHGVDTQFGPEMKSTGEVLGIAPNFHDALLKGLIGAGYTFKTPGPASCCIFTVKDSDKPSSWISHGSSRAWATSCTAPPAPALGSTSTWSPATRCAICPASRPTSWTCCRAVWWIMCSLPVLRAATPSATPSACAARLWS